MRNLFSYLVVVVLLVGCGKPQHNYVVNTGDTYGYQQHVSDEDKAKGVTFKPLRMMTYVGKRNGSYQIIDANGVYIVVLECSDPCKTFKTMAFRDNGVHVQTVYIQTTPGSLAARVFEDAMNGFLEPFNASEAGSNGNRVWFSEKGIQFTTTTEEESNP